MSKIKQEPREQFPPEQEIEASAEAGAAPDVEIEEEAVEAPVDEEASLRQQLEEEQRKSAEYYDQWLRSVAELRNYKKRIEQERQQQSREANAVLVSHLLPILDDFERAMTILPDEKLRQFSWIEGILLVYRRLYAILEQHGLQLIQTVGQPFDPYVHEAILFEEVSAEKDQLVLAELQKGFKLHDRLLRPALVKVGKATGESVPESIEETPVSERAGEESVLESAEEEPTPEAEAATE